MPDCYQSSIGSMKQAIAAVAVALAAVATLAAPATADARASKDAYRGAGTWIDIYDSALLVDPAATVQAPLAARRAHDLRRDRQLHEPSRPGASKFPLGLAALIDAAHANGMRVVALVPARLQEPEARPAAKPRRDPLHDRRGRALRLVRARHRVERRALDRAAQPARAEALEPHPPAVGRQLSARRDRARPALDLGLAAEPLAPFPYRRLRAYYDVFLPMAYSTSAVRARASCTATRPRTSSTCAS